jgi:hypothetical protein
MDYGATSGDTNYNYIFIGGNYTEGNSLGIPAMRFEDFAQIKASGGTYLAGGVLFQHLNSSIVGGQVNWDSSGTYPEALNYPAFTFDESFAEPGGEGSTAIAISNFSPFDQSAGQIRLWCKYSELTGTLPGFNCLTTLQLRLLKVQRSQFKTLVVKSMDVLEPLKGAGQVSADSTATIAASNSSLHCPHRKVTLGQPHLCLWEPTVARILYRKRSTPSGWPATIKVLVTV